MEAELNGAMEFVWGEEEEDIREKVMADLREEKEKLREMVRSQEEIEAERQAGEEILKEARKRVREEIEAEERDRLVEELRKEERLKIRGRSGPGVAGSRAGDAVYRGESSGGGLDAIRRRREVENQVRQEENRRREVENRRRREEDQQRVEEDRQLFGDRGLVSLFLRAVDAYSANFREAATGGEAVEVADVVEGAEASVDGAKGRDRDILFISTKILLMLSSERARILAMSLCTHIFPFTFVNGSRPQLCL